MAERKGILSRLFGKPKSDCCAVTIEEVPASETKTSSKDGNNAAGQTCCGGRADDDEPDADGKLKPHTT